MRFAHDQGLRPLLVTLWVTIMVADAQAGQRATIMVPLRGTIMRFAHACLCKAQERGRSPCMQEVRPISPLCRAQDCHLCDDHACAKRMKEGVPLAWSRFGGQSPLCKAQERGRKKKALF